MAGRVLLSLKLTARLAGVGVPAVRAAIRRGRLNAVTLAEAERAAVRSVDLREAARYYGWPPGLVDRLDDEMRVGAPEGQDVYKLDEESDGPEGVGRRAAGSRTVAPRVAETDVAEYEVAVNAVVEVEHVARGSRLVAMPSAARDAWARTIRKTAGDGLVPADPPIGFRLILPRESAALRRREVYDLVVDGEVVGTVLDEGFALYVRDKCRRGEVFVNGQGAIKFRPRVPARSTRMNDARKLDDLKRYAGEAVRAAEDDDEETFLRKLRRLLAIAYDGAESLRNLDMERDRETCIVLEHVPDLPEAMKWIRWAWPMVTGAGGDDA